MSHILFLYFHPIYKFLYFLYKYTTDRKQIAWMRSYIKEGMTVVDIGSNIGFYAIFFSKLVGERGKVYAFEPDELNFKFLKQHTKGYKNIIVKKYAVGNKNGPLYLYLAHKFNVDHHTYKTDEVREIKKIKSITLDTFFGTKDHVNFIKSDIQGYDYYALQGAQKLIKRQQHIGIVGEFWPYGLKKAGTSSKKYLQLLHQLHLTIQLHTPHSFDTLETDKTFYTDYIAYK